MPTPGTFPSTVAISFSQVNTEFGLTTPSPMNLKYRFAGGNYTPATPVIPTVQTDPFPMNVLHGRSIAFNQTFTSSTTWTATVTANIKVLVVGGGGAGGIVLQPGGPGRRSGGGGGGGGVVYNGSFPVVRGTVYTVTVGNGGNTLPSPGDGSPSAFSTITAGGGGGGGGINFANGRNGVAPGGGGGGATALNPGFGGIGSAPGKPGGDSSAVNIAGISGGGGGASTAGGSTFLGPTNGVNPGVQNPNYGTGGAGISYPQISSSYFGGGGAAGKPGPGSAGASGGIGGGGPSSPLLVVAGGTNTGGGGGGGQSFVGRQGHQLDASFGSGAYP